MRLTLRALLAYLYNVLEPADADEFSAKVQESAVASGLVQRIRAITKKMRMNAPRIDGKGTADDANNVAEYLDNSLPEEQVADFERACINSDMHLAEVASSYQILTMVLGKAAEYPESLQTRVYRLPLDLATTHKDSDGDGAQRKRLKKAMEKVAQSARETNGSQASVRTDSTHPVAQVPDYLRDKRGTLGKWLAIIAVILIVALLGIMASGPLDSTNGVIGWMFEPNELADVDTQSAENNEIPPAGNAADSVEKNTAATTTNKETTDGAQSRSDSTQVQANTIPTKEPATDDAGAKATTDVVEASPGPPLPPPPPVEPQPNSSATASDASGAKASGRPELTPPATGSSATKVAPANPMDVGRYVSDDQVLTRFDMTSGMWFLVPPRSILTAGERLVVLPTFRPQVALASGVQVTFAGESEVQMAEPRSAAAARMDVEYGRFLVVTLGNAGAKLELDFGGVQGTLTLEDSDTVVAIDVRHFLPPGSPVDNDERFQVIEVHAAAGQVRWEETGIDPLDIPTQHALTYVAGSDRELAGPFAAPDWIDALNLSEIDRFTSTALQRELLVDKPAHIRLQELMTDRRTEVRALAARGLAQLGTFEPLIRELGNPQQRAYWVAEVETLRQALSRGSESQSQISQSLESLYPGEAESLMRLLLGFSAEQLESGGARELVQFLESPEMPVRVVAIHTLRQITGVQLNYRPERPPAENRVSILRWIERERDGSIVYKTSPSPLGERKPLNAASAAPAKAPPAGEE